MDRLHVDREEGVLLVSAAYFWTESHVKSADVGEARGTARSLPARSSAFNVVPATVAPLASLEPLLEIQALPVLN
jgi:hypothetical protein